MSLPPTQIPQNSGLPELVDTHIANTLDLHIATSDFIKILDKYGDYVALSYIWSNTKHSSDPITAQAEFFRDLVKGKLNLQTDERGSVNWKAGSDSYNFARLDQYLQPHEIWIRSENGLPESLVEFNDRNESTSVSGDTTKYHAVNLVTGQERWVPINEKDLNVSQTVENKLNALSSEFGCENMSEEFLYFWYRGWQGGLWSYCY